MRRARCSSAASCAGARGVAARASAAEGAALCLQRRRDELRPGEDRRPVFAHHQRAHLRGACTTYDHLARPAKIKPLTRRRHARGHSTTSAPGRSSVRPGIYFADDPAFEGSLKEARAGRAGLRLRDQALRRSGAAAPSTCTSFENVKLLGLAELRQARDRRQEAVRLRRARCRGLRALDRYTLQSSWPSRAPRFVARAGVAAALFGARGARGGRGLRRRGRGASGRHRAVQAGAVAAQLADRAGAQPALPRAALRRRPAADDAEGQALRRDFKGRRLPMVDRVEISIIEEDAAALAGIPQRRARRARAAAASSQPWRCRTASSRRTWRKRACSAADASAPTSRTRFFNMDDPMVGGYTPEKVALRRAIALALRHAREIAARAQRPGGAGAVADRAAHQRLRSRASRAR